MLRSGIIGLGRIAWAYDGGRFRGDRSITHASCLERHPRTRLVIGCDPDPEQRARFSAAAGVEATGSLHDFLACGLDLVAIASPTALHAAHVRAAIDAGVRYIWLEKPATQTLGEHRALAKHSTKHGVRIAVNYPRRYMQQYAALRDWTREAEPVEVQVDYSRALAVNGVHLIDQVGAMFPGLGTPAIEWVASPGSENPSFGFVLGNTRVTVNGLDVPYHCIDLRAIAASGRVSVIRGGIEAWVEERTENPEYPGFYHLDRRRPLVPAEKCLGQMRDASYHCLTNLVDAGADLASSLQSAGFAAEVLDRVARWTAR